MHNSQQHPLVKIPSSQKSRTIGAAPPRRPTRPQTKSLVCGPKLSHLRLVQVLDVKLVVFCGYLMLLKLFDAISGSCIVFPCCFSSIWVRLRIRRSNNSRQAAQAMRCVWFTVEGCDISPHCSSTFFQCYEKKIYIYIQYMNMWCR